MAFWTCTVCGKREPWAEGWSRWSSIALDETCPHNVPAMCSQPCAEIGMGKIKSGEWVLPQLAPEPGGYRVIIEKKGY